MSRGLSASRNCFYQNVTDLRQSLISEPIFQRSFGDVGFMPTSVCFNHDYCKYIEVIDRLNIKVIHAINKRTVFALAVLSRRGNLVTFENE